MAIDEQILIEENVQQERFQKQPDYQKILSPEEYSKFMSGVESNMYRMAIGLELIDEKVL